MTIHRAAVRVLGSTYEAARWLFAPCEALDGRTPHQAVEAGETARVGAVLRGLAAEKAGGFERIGDITKRVVAKVEARRK